MTFFGWCVLLEGRRKIQLEFQHCKFLGEKKGKGRNSGGRRKRNKREEIEEEQNV